MVTSITFNLLLSIKYNDDVLETFLSNMHDMSDIFYIFADVMKKKNTPCNLRYIYRCSSSTNC